LTTGTGGLVPPILLIDRGGDGPVLLLPSDVRRIDDDRGGEVVNGRAAGGANELPTPELDRVNVDDVVLVDDDVVDAVDVLIKANAES
jgi:hypothetical protein